MQSPGSVKTQARRRKTMSTQRFPNRNRLTHGRLTETASKSLLALILTSTALAQVSIINPAPPDAVMGFETAAGWVVKSTSPATGASATAIRTQGSHAFSLANPAGVAATLTSAVVASTEPALAAVGEAGSIFAVDLMPPSTG